MASDAGLPLYLAKRLARATAAGASRVVRAPSPKCCGSAACSAPSAPRPGWLSRSLVAPGAGVLRVLDGGRRAAVERGARDAGARLSRARPQRDRIDDRRFAAARHRRRRRSSCCMAHRRSCCSRRRWSCRRRWRSPCRSAPLDGFWSSDGVRTCRLDIGGEAGRRGRMSRSGLGILISALYFRCDVFFIEHWHGLEAVGAYNAAFRIVEALRLFPAAVLAVSYPALCTARDTAAAARADRAARATGPVAIAAVVYFSAPFTACAALRRRASPTPRRHCHARARAAVLLRELRAHAPGDRLGRPARVSRRGRRGAAGNVVGNLALIPSRRDARRGLSTLATEVVVSVGCVVALARCVDAVAAGAAWTRDREARRDLAWRTLRRSSRSCSPCSTRRSSTIRSPAPAARGV